jgi:hypothetical protein
MTFNVTSLSHEHIGGSASIALQRQEGEPPKVTFTTIQVSFALPPHPGQNEDAVTARVKAEAKRLLKEEADPL